MVERCPSHGTFLDAQKRCWTCDRLTAASRLSVEAAPSAGDGTPGPARPETLSDNEIMLAARLAVTLKEPQRLRDLFAGDSGGPPEAGPSDEMEKLKAHLVIVENGYREAAHYILNYGRADHADWKARAQRILDTAPGGCTPWLSELLALRAELGRAGSDDKPHPSYFEQMMYWRRQAGLWQQRADNSAAAPDAERPPQETADG